MLRKELCKRCLQAGWKTGWQDRDEVRWLAGLVACPKGQDLSGVGLLGNMHGRVLEEPRQGCHYYLEQLVMNQTLTEKVAKE